jgi:single-strand DNA-binding protein
VIAVGHVYTSEYEDRDGNRRSSLEMRATSVGPDLSRAIVRIEKPGYLGPDAEPAPAAADTGEEPAAEEDSVASGDGDEVTPLSLSA